KFSVNAETMLDVAPAVEIKKISPSPIVWTSARGDHVLTITTMVQNNQAAPFRGTLELSSAALDISAVGANVSINPGEARAVELKSNAAPFANTRAGSNTGSHSVALTIKNSGGAAITRRNVSVSFSNARVAPGLSVGYIPSFDQTLEHSLAALGVKAKA